MKKAADILWREAANERAEYQNALDRYEKEKGRHGTRDLFQRYLKGLSDRIKELEAAAQFLEEVSDSEWTKDEIAILKERIRRPQEENGIKLFKTEDHERSTTQNGAGKGDDPKDRQLTYVSRLSELRAFSFDLSSFGSSRPYRRSKNDGRCYRKPKLLEASHRK
jgi:hypothetical protein